MKWQIGEKFTVDASINYNHSDWFRSTNTYLFNSNLNTGITVDLEANGDGVIKVTPSRDLNDLTFWNWNALRIQPVQREVWQKGGRVERRMGVRRCVQARRRLEPRQIPSRNHQLGNHQLRDRRRNVPTSPSGIECAPRWRRPASRMRKSRSRTLSWAITCRPGRTASCTRPRISTWA